MTEVTPILTVTISNRKTRRQTISSPTNNNLTGSSVWGALEKARNADGSRVFTGTEIAEITKKHAELNKGYRANRLKKGDTIDLSDAIIAAGYGHKFGTLTTANKPSVTVSSPIAKPTQPMHITVVSRRTARRNPAQNGDATIMATSFEAGLLKLKDADGNPIFTKAQACLINMAHNKLQAKGYNDRKVLNGTQLDIIEAVNAAGFGHLLAKLAPTEEATATPTTTSTQQLEEIEVPTNPTNNPFSTEDTALNPEPVAEEEDAETTAAIPAPIVEAEDTETTAAIPAPVVEAEDTEATAEIPAPMVEAEDTATTAAIPAPVVEAEDTEATATIPAPVVEAEGTATTAAIPTPVVDTQSPVENAETPAPIIEQKPQTPQFVTSKPITSEELLEQDQIAQELAGQFIDNPTAILDMDELPTVGKIDNMRAAEIKDRTYWHARTMLANKEISIYESNIKLLEENGADPAEIAAEKENLEATKEELAQIEAFRTRFYPTEADELANLDYDQRREIALVAHINNQLSANKDLSDEELIASIPSDIIPSAYNDELMSGTISALRQDSTAYNIYDTPMEKSLSDKKTQLAMEKFGSELTLAADTPILHSGEIAQPVVIEPQKPVIEPLASSEVERQILGIRENAKKKFGVRQFQEAQDNVLWNINHRTDGTPRPDAEKADAIAAIIAKDREEWLTYNPGFKAAIYAITSKEVLGLVNQRLADKGWKDVKTCIKEEMSGGVKDELLNKIRRFD